MVEDDEPLHLLHLGVASVDAVELLLEQLAHLVRLGELARIRRQAPVLRPGDDLVCVERDERHRVGPPVAVHHRARDPA